MEDETDVRTAAQETLRRALESGVFEQLRRVDYLRREHFKGLDEFVGRVALDPARAAAKQRTVLKSKLPSGATHGWPGTAA